MASFSRANLAYIRLDCESSDSSSFQALHIRRIHAAVLRLPVVYVASDMPCLRQISFTFMPTSASLRIMTIWVSLDRKKFSTVAGPSGPTTSHKETNSRTSSGH
jgi:hypothetical protein